MLKLDSCAAAEHKIILPWPKLVSNSLQRIRDAKRFVDDDDIALLGRIVLKGHEDNTSFINPSRPMHF